MSETTLEAVTVTAQPERPAYLTQNERSPADSLTLLRSMDFRLGRVHTALPGIVEDFDPERLACSIRLAVRVRALTSGGEWESREFPLLVDVPVVFPGGGGFALTFPVTQGDEALVVFASRCVDAWWQQGEAQEQTEVRMHSISDAFALVGVRSLARPLADGAYTGGVELRSDDGAQHIRATGGGWHILGNITVQGGITASGDVVGQGTSLHTHVHGGVEPGGGNTGQPA